MPRPVTPLSLSSAATRGASIWATPKAPAGTAVRSRSGRLRPLTRWPIDLLRALAPNDVNGNAIWAVRRRRKFRRFDMAGCPFVCWLVELQHGAATSRTWQAAPRREPGDVIQNVRIAISNVVPEISDDKFVR